MQLLTEIIFTFFLVQTQCEKKTKVFKVLRFHTDFKDNLEKNATQKANNHKEDPSVHFTTPQMIVSNGYPAETHNILTDDGYILAIHRIPHNKETAKIPEKTILIHHGLLGSSADWVIRGPDKGLAYILSQAGYDVWMANARGNTYSRKHISISPRSSAFWNFTFHDIAQQDLPAVIDYITKVKGTKINYVGFSMGTTALFVLLSTRPEYNQILRAGFALAPIAYMANVKGPIKLLSNFVDDISFLMKFLNENEFLPHNESVDLILKLACDALKFEAWVCENAIFLMTGFDNQQFDRSFLPMMLGHVPAGASTKTMVHYAQEVRSGKFQQFHYGKEGNLREYGSETPPEYKLSNITLPIALFSGSNDWLATTEDVTKLYHELNNPLEHYVVPFKAFNHIDFMWAIDAPKLVYKKLIELLLLQEQITSLVDNGANSSVHKLKDLN